MSDSAIATQARNSEIGNVYVRSHAQAVFDLATSMVGQEYTVYGNNMLLNDLNAIFSLSAAADGKTAIFWSGNYRSPGVAS